MDEGAKEIVGAGVDGEIAELILGRDGIRRSVELIAETDLGLIEVSLFGRRERSVVLPCIDELLREVRSVAKILLISEFGTYNGVRLVVSFAGRIDFRTTYTCDVAIVVAEVLLALDEARVCADDFFELRVVIYLSHIWDNYTLIKHEVRDSWVSNPDKERVTNDILSSLIMTDLYQTYLTLTSNLSQTYHALNFVQSYEKLWNFARKKGIFFAKSYYYIYKVYIVYK